ncbi:hypothetical protein PGT21_025336 [Puccinia graminis f. sp. tritici]|uniref:Uncharacterized protein n=1 Tax=Puccinia graminis f. sp. tritici TaxID=56615 RepID=A0A5B0Q732_PUCGR|nr:hypothetical protein PGT21_025336 [Puccinia graminis f. sp. tritici]
MVESSTPIEINPQSSHCYRIEECTPDGKSASVPSWAAIKKLTEIPKPVKRRWERLGMSRLKMQGLRRPTVLKD